MSYNCSLWCVKWVFRSILTGYCSRALLILESTHFSIAYCTAMPFFVLLDHLSFPLLSLHLFWNAFSNVLLALHRSGWGKVGRKCRLSFKICGETQVPPFLENWKIAPTLCIDVRVKQLAFLGSQRWPTMFPIGFGLQNLSSGLSGLGEAVRFSFLNPILEIV